MTETYPAMNAQIIAILRWTDDPMVLYAAQRIEELERMAGIQNECLETAVEVLREYAKLSAFDACTKAHKTAIDIEARLAELEAQ